MLHIKQKLGNIVSGRNVIFVGPAPTLMSTNSGKRINKFDVVIRTNDSFNMPLEYWDDYGSKCDVLYLNNDWLRRNFLKNTNRQHLLDISRTITQVTHTKLILVKGKRSKKLVKHIIKKTAPKGSQEVHVEMTSYNWLKKREFWLKESKEENEDSFYEPTLISYILSDLDLTAPKKVYLTGVDFYSGTKHWTDFYNKTVNQKKSSISRKKIHSTMGDKQYLKYHMEKNKIEIDPVIRNNLD